MSGGHFSSNLCNFIDDLEQAIVDRKQPNSYGETPYDFSEPVIAKLREVLDHCDRTAHLMKCVDYLYSGDCGEEDFLEELGK